MAWLIERGAVPSFRLGPALAAAFFWAALHTSGAPRTYLPPKRPIVFPAQYDFTIPVGSAQLFLPYLETPSDVPLDDYRLTVDLPAALRLVAIDSVAGVPGRIVQQSEHNGRRIVEIAIGNPFGVGMELSICWQDSTPATLVYMPALQVGNTRGWRKLTTVLRSPTRAASCKPLLIKWQKRGLFGTAYFDDIAVREAGTDKNLLRAGTFEEPYWRERRDRHVVRVERNETLTYAARISGTRANSKRQDALWVGERIPVKPDTDYVFEAWVKGEGIASTKTRSRAALLLRLDDETFRGGNIRFGFRSHGGQIVEVPQTVPVRVLPRLLGKRPRESLIMPCYYGDVVSPETSAAIAENVLKSGINALFGSANNRVAEAVVRNGVRLTWAFPYRRWQIFPAPDWVETHPERLAVRFDGRTSKAFVCPTYALQPGSEFAPELEAWVKQAVADTPYDGVDIDYEVPVVDPPTFCFCRRCLDAFRREAKLPPGAELNAKSVLAQYRKEWTEFRCHQNAELVRRIANWIRGVDPKMHVSVYSGYQRLRTREHYGIDWSLLGPHIDMGIAGYNGSQELLAATIVALAPTPFMGGEKYYRSFRTAASGPLRRQGWKMRLLRCYVNGGCNGVLIWHLPVIDGQGYFETSQAAAVMADFENFFRRGERADGRIQFVKPWPEENYAAFEYEGKLLVLLFNSQNEASEVGPLSVKGWRAFRAQRYDDTRGRLAPPQTLEKAVSVAPWDCQVWLLSEGH